ncbi:MAG: hypothetical protein JNM17_19520 [Archangium sp.]|nr:hypothetical protein [Archangium sp.]
MSRYSRNIHLKERASHKQLRASVRRELNVAVARVEHASRAEWLEVLADALEEQGELEKAEQLRNDLDLDLPLKPNRLAGSSSNWLVLRR